MAKSKKTNEQMLVELQQRMNRDRARERELKYRVETEKRKKRNHTLILIAAEMLKHYDDETEQLLIDADDDTVKAWVNAEMQNIRKKDEIQENQGFQQDYEQY